MCFVLLPFYPTTPMPAEHRFGHNPRNCEDESSSQRSYERERWMEMTHPTGDYETGRNVCQHVGQWKRYPLICIWLLAPLDVAGCSSWLVLIKNIRNFS